MKCAHASLTLRRYICFDLSVSLKTLKVINCISFQKTIPIQVYPVKVDKKFKEYYLEGKDASTHIFYFCPICGGRLPESKSGDFFLTPSESEVNNIYEKIKNAETANEIIKILGVPDEKHIPSQKDIKKEVSLGRNVITHLTRFWFLARDSGR